jgi:hypothetical protein
LRKVNQIGAHIFYVWPQAGTPDWSHIAYGGREPLMAQLRGDPAQSAPPVNASPAVTIASLLQASSQPPPEPAPALAAAGAIEPQAQTAPAPNMPAPLGGRDERSAEILKGPARSTPRPPAQLAKRAPSHLPVPRGW